MALIPIVRVLFFINSFGWSQGWPGTMTTSNAWRSTSTLPSTSHSPTSTIASTTNGGEEATTWSDIKWLIDVGVSVLILATIILVFAYFRWKWAKASTQCISQDFFDRLRFRVATGQDGNCDHLEHCCVNQSEGSGIRDRVYCIHGMHTDNLHPIPENSSNDQSDTPDYINVASRRTDQR